MDGGRACFCLAKARPIALGSGDGARGRIAHHRRAELARLKASALQRLAEAAGVEPAALETALDDDTPKPALINLLLEHEDRSHDRLRQELELLKPAALQRRALAAGADQDALDDALEEDAPKAALTKIILSLEGGGGGGGGEADEGGAVEEEAETALRSELEGLRLKELRACANQANVPAEDLDDAIDSDDPKRAVIDLLLLRQPSGSVDAAELMALAPPDADYRVVYVDSPSEDPAASALRQELGSLRLKELRKRAEGAGVSEDQLEGAIDSNEPKATLINLLVEILTTSSKNDQDLRSELEGLRLKELRTRAKRANIEQDDVDDAVDSDDPKAAMVELLLWHTPDAAGASTLSSDKPHFG